MPEFSSVRKRFDGISKTNIQTIKSNFSSMNDVSKLKTNSLGNKIYHLRPLKQFLSFFDGMEMNFYDCIRLFTAEISI